MNGGWWLGDPGGWVDALLVFGLGYGVWEFVRKKWGRRGGGRDGLRGDPEFEKWLKERGGEWRENGRGGYAVIFPEHGIAPGEPLYNPPPPDAKRARERPAKQAGAGLTLPAWLRRQPAGERVFVKDIGNWPKLWKLPDGGLLLTARYASPDSLKQARNAAVFVGFLAAFWLLDRLAVPVNDGWWRVNWLAVVIGAGFWWLAFVVLRPVFRLTLWRINSPLRMTFERGAIDWQGEAQLRSFWPFGKRREKIFANEARQPRVVAPHRKAGDEMRKAQERVRKRRKEGALYYQQCSEVLIDAGPNHANWLPVAEIAFDEHGEKALKLVAAIMLADGAAQGTAPEPATEAGATAPPGRKRRGLLG